MHRLSPSQGTLCWAAIRSLLLLLVLAEILYCSGTAIPNVCLDSRPRSSNADCANTSRKFFFHVNKLRCKPFRLCEKDADIYDSQQGFNYFQTMDECKQACSEVVQCPTMEPISNGALNNGTSQGLNATITYSCVEGYELVGSATLTCQLNGNWSGSEPYCQEQCRTPGPVEKAMILPVQTYYSVGSIVTYTCDQGHVGGGQRVCQLNRTWTEDNIICQYVECPAVQAITNGVVTEHSRHYGSNVTYSCLAGFELIGPSVRECLANSSWSGNEPHCQVMCPAPTPSDNAVVSPQRDYYSVGSKVQYACNVGYVGSTERQCKPNGTWSGTQPICEALQIECPDPIPIESGYVSAPDLSVGSKLMYFCNVNYTLIGNSTRVCTESGEWSGSKPVCARLILLYGSAKQDVTNSTLSLPTGEEEHRILCVTEPKSYPGRIAPTWENKSYPHGVRVDGSQLVFASVFTSGQQKGEYLCKSGSQRATVNVTVVSSNDPHHKAPMLAVPPDTFCASQGSVATFQCVFTGCPIPDVSWYHNGTRIENGNKTKISSIPFQNIQVCSLAIEQITTRDVGNYQCIGSNIKGNFSSQVVQLTMEHGTSKRSVQTDTRQVKSLHCRKDPKAVTVVGHMRRVIKKAAKDFTVYRLQVHKVLRGAEAILGERKRITVVVPPTQNPTLRLQQDTTYIITGINIDNKLLFVDHNSIQTHSNELEDLIQTC